MSKKKSSAKEPFLPLFFGDFLGATAEWDGEERSLYLLLLGYQWTLGSLPADPRKLRKLVDYQVESFERWWPTVSTKFEQVGDRLLNRRLEVHRNKTREVSGKNAESGKKGAQARWGKNGERHADVKRTPSESMASAMQPDSERHESAIAQRHAKSDGDVNGNPSHPIPFHISPVDTSSRTSTSVDASASDPPGVGNGRDPGAEQRDRELTPEARIAIPLRKAGVKVTSMHPTLVAWVKDGYTLEQLQGALAIARESKGDAVEIHAKYLDTIVRDPSNWPRLNQARAPTGAVVLAPRRPGAPMTHADVMAALDAAVDPDSEDFA